MEKGKAINPRWIGEEPAWDIVLPSGEIHKGVAKSKIKSIVGEEARNGNGHPFSTCGLVVEGDIQIYCKHFEKGR